MADSEQLKRIRAAASYIDGKGLEALGRRVKPSARTLRRNAQHGKLDDGRLYEIHKATDVPLWFLKGGWANYPRLSAPPADEDAPTEQPEDLIPPEDRPDESEGVGD